MKFPIQLFTRVIGLCACLFMLIPAVSLQAEENGLFAPLKAEMQAIARENTELTKQNKTLRIQLVGLQLEVENREDELRELDPGYVSALSSKRERTKEPLTSEVYRQLEMMEDAELSREAKEIFMSGQHMDLDEAQKLRELKLYDLAIRKEELKLDIQEKNRLLKDIDYERRMELESIQRESEVIFKREQELRNRIAEIQARLLSAPQNIEILRMENKVLREEIEELRDKLTQ